jgi:hypothetical protein
LPPTLMACLCDQSSLFIPISIESIDYIYIFN